MALERIVARDEQIARLSALRAREVHDSWLLLEALAPVDRSAGGPVWVAERVAEVEFFTEVAGLFSEDHANVIAHYTEGLEGEALSRYDTTMARLATDLTYTQLEYRARAQAEASRSTTAVERVLTAVKTRRVYADPAKDGMANLTVVAPPRLPRCTRPRTGPWASPRGSKTRAIQQGCGPIDPVTAARLTAARLTADATSWRWVLTDSITSRILRLSPTNYRPTREMRDHVQLVPPFCIFPSRADTSMHADIDHTVDFAGGA